MNLEQWEKDANLRPHLEQLINDPVFQIALSIVKNQGLRPPVPVATCDLIQYGAMMGFQRFGYFEAIQNLVNLSKIAPKPPKADPKAWSEAKLEPEVFVGKEPDLPAELKPAPQPASPQPEAAPVEPQPKL